MDSQVNRTQRRLSGDHRYSHHRRSQLAGIPPLPRWAWRFCFSGRYHHDVPLAGTHNIRAGLQPGSHQAGRPGGIPGIDFSTSLVLVPLPAAGH